MKTVFGEIIPPRKLPALREFDGPLTADLVQRPGQFGLGNVPARLVPDATTTTVCGFCSTGCGLNAHLKDGVAINLSADVNYPVNLGMACPKGWEALAPLAASDRATTPLLRKETDGEFVATDWDEALQIFAIKFKAIIDKHGAESIAFLSTGQIATEEMAFLGALFKFGMGGLHCDSNTRQCMATAHVAYKQSFGFDAPPYTYADFEQSDVLLFIGANPCIAHPIMWQRVLRNPNKPEIIVIDPRKTETAMNATQHLALAPKSDLTLLYGLANLIIQNDGVDRAFVERSTTGFVEFVEFVRQFTPDKVAAATGLTVGELFRCAETIRRGKAVSFWWTMGVNQGHESTRTAQAIINLALMTGNIGRPGTGANSITGQCNAMGSRIFANATGLLGGRDFLNAAHRSEVAGLLGIPVEKIPAVNSLAYDQIVERVRDGRIKGLWVIGTNSAHSWVDTSGLGEALKRLDFLVVQDMYHSTDTAKLAHLVLPAAGWGEKEGTLINSERRIGVIKRIAHAPGQALADFHIFRLVAHYWGCDALFREWTSPQAVFQILKRLSAGRPCDFSGVEDYRHLDASGGIQWPWAESKVEELKGLTADEAASPSLQPSSPSSFQPAAERRLFADGRFYHADGRAKFLFDEPRPQPEPAEAAFPFVLLTGRGTSAQWHTQTRTGKSAVLRRLYPEEVYVEINPVDARRLGLRARQWVSVSSRRGEARARAVLSSGVQPGHVFMPMHYVETNALTATIVDPHSRQPSYKACAVNVCRA
jgi:anaerobic selenocysteine-containing dehydrogenase